MAARANVPVLCWHQIRAATARDSASDRTYIVSPKTLAAQLGALDRAGYHPVTGPALVAHVALGKRLPRKPVLLPSTTPPPASTRARCRCCAATTSSPRSSS